MKKTSLKKCFWPSKRGYKIYKPRVIMARVWYIQHFHRNRSYWCYFYLCSNLGMGAERFRPRINDTVLKTQVAVEMLWINKLADLAHPSGAYRYEIYTDINQIHIKGLYWKIEPDCTTDKCSFVPWTMKFEYFWSPIWVFVKPKFIQ